MSECEQLIDRLGEMFRRRGAEAYLGEPVTVAQHMLQCAALAAAEGAAEPLIAAALLHDIGHITGRGGEYTIEDIQDRRHEEASAASLQGFPPLVVESARLHVAAKRYLCAVDPTYYGRLSEASRHSLALQGGAMDADEQAVFEAQTFHREAVQVRRWDDGGKSPGLRTFDFDHYRPLLQRVLGA